MGIEGICNTIVVEGMSRHTASGRRRCFLGSLPSLCTSPAGGADQKSVVSQSCVILTSPQSHGHEEDTEAQATNHEKEICSGGQRDPFPGLP